MNRVLHGRNRRLLFRSYLTLAGGLLIVAVVLDLGFGILQTRDEADIDRWLESTFQLIEARLADVPAGQRDMVASAIAAELGLGVRLLTRDQVFVNDVAAHRLAPLVDADGATSYLRDAESIAAIIRLGPIAEPRESLLLRLLPPLFYLSIFVVVGLWLRPLLKDIDLISAAAQRFAADYREPLATEERTTELKPLAKNLDEMAARLAGVLGSQKELIAALSHEMRTPLARLRFALAVSGDGADDALRERLAAMSNDVQEIDGLIASMLNYARLDHPDIKMHHQAVPCRSWLEKIVARSTSAEIAIDLSTDSMPDEAWMDPRLMELALSNLLGNAIRYAGHRVRCSLSLADGSDAYILCVEDDGPGIPDGSRDRVFSAFARLDDSRSRDTGGCGLGLAIVARIAALHGGGVQLDTSPALGGARFSIRWPVVNRLAKTGHLRDQLRSP